MQPVNSYMASELESDMWIEQNIPGGLESPLGIYLDNLMGGNPNPTMGQILGSDPEFYDIPEFDRLVRHDDFSHVTHFSQYTSSYGYSYGYSVS
ncbi:unnamed protein product [Rotaria sp. Silwood1]|nr:unnamed protein product [Rotaria sp. Silwood1]CAF1182558.1 unnamed protein product [Rotaria sp. Silwood1]CAF1201590.1 unnamed protein product [Rotaria sp. Silwood1]CAF3463431.1 unnamed protein product [Rotaria sp. Silwood1]CAF3486158.1 unnamed protein product [Rotaria sp. Silwood1]